LDHQKLDLVKGMDELVMVYKRYEKKKVQFFYRKKIEKGVFYGAGIQFVQVISVILENAFKYTFQGSVSLDLIQTSKEMRCRVIDTGPGISDKEKKKVFERFYRSGHQVGGNFDKGMGLGLYIAKKITEKTGGELELTDNPEGKGCCFEVRFPVFKKKNRKR
jgi:signal transduction histidine kinase